MEDSFVTQLRGVLWADEDMKRGLEGRPLGGGAGLSLSIVCVLPHNLLLLFHAPPPGNLGSVAPLPHWSGSTVTEFSAQRRYRTLLPHAASDETGHQAARRPKPPDSRTAQERLALKRDRSGGFNLAVRARRTT